MKRGSVIKSYEFDYELLKVSPPIGRSVNNKNLKYTSIPFNYDGKEALVRLEESSFKIFKNNKDENISYSTSIAVDDCNERFFSKLESRIRQLVNNPKVQLIQNKNNEFGGVSLKVYPKNSDGSMNCKFSTGENGVIVPIDSKVLEDSRFYGAYIFTISDFFDRQIKTIRLYPKEFLVKEFEDKMSYFDEDDEVFD